ncbi:MAG: T9SS type A sorting domain-containing protein [Bacteroidota bacterium]
MNQTITRFLFSFVILLSSYHLMAQPAECNGTRYILGGFTADSTVNIQYGQATTLGGVEQDLLMDVYEPAGDTIAQRPLVILAHGGSFVRGTRKELGPLCEVFAAAGYVCATISYRLQDIETADSTEFAEELIMSMNDLKASVRYFRQDAATNNTFRINPDQIYVGGTSAGAIMAVNMAYMAEDDEIPAYLQEHIDNNGGFEGNSNDITEFTSEVQGVVSYSGSILRLSWMDAGDPPYVAIHEELDPVVLCGLSKLDTSATPYFIRGACDMEARAEEVGIANNTVVFEGSTEHVGYFFNANQLAVVFATAGFLEDLYCNQQNTVSIDPTLSASVSIYPNPTHDKFQVTSDYLSGLTEVKLYNMRGQVVRTQTQVWQRSNSLEVSLSDLPNGIYTVMLSMEEGRVMKRVLKN